MIVDTPRSVIIRLIDAVPGRCAPPGGEPVEVPVPGRCTWRVMISDRSSQRREVCMHKHSSVEAYMAALSGDQRRILEELRATIRAAAPEATEQISYDMPAFRANGRLLVSYAAFTRHFSLFPASGAVLAALGDEIAPYHTGKGTIRFTADRPLPADLVARIVKIRLEESAGPGG